MDSLLLIGEEVATALAEGTAVVALETTLVAHGFPAPVGVEVGLASEDSVRAAGAVPATIGVLDGRIVVGLEADQLERFTPEARKLGPRDLAACVAQGAVGATTVGGTLVAAAALGIRFMGTGGLGGVHRGFPDPPDVSADLGACARLPVVIASSGVKSLLDVPATMELLETLGVPVIGYRVDTVPLFYQASGGPPVSARAETVDEIADIADRHWRLRRWRHRRRPSPRREPRGGRAHRGGRRRGAGPRGDGPGGDALRPRRAARALGRRDAPCQPRPDRRQRGPRRRDRGRICEDRPMSLYDRVRDLPLSVEGYDLAGLSADVSSGFLRQTTIVTLRGGGEEGVGEDVTYDGAEHDRTADRGADLPLAGTWTLDGFSQHLATLPLFDHEPEQHAYLDYRRWAYESAALDLALRQAGRSLADVVDRPVAPLHFVVSTRLGEEPTTERVAAWLELYPGLRFKLDATPDWTDELVAELATLGCVDSVDFKGQYHGTSVDTVPDVSLYERVIGGLPDVWLEDPALTPETEAVLDPVRRPRHVGRADPQRRRHRGPALAAAHGQREAVPLRKRGAGSLPPTTTARRAGSLHTAEVSSSSASAEGRSSSSPRCSIPRRRTTSPPPASTPPSRPRGCRRARCTWPPGRRA